MENIFSYSMSFSCFTNYPITTSKCLILTMQEKHSIGKATILWLQSSAEKGEDK